MASQGDNQAPSKYYDEDTKEQCRFFYAKYEESIRQGTPHLILPKGLGDAMGDAGIEAAAWRLAAMTLAPVSVHYDPHYKCYRIGPDDHIPYRPKFVTLLNINVFDEEPIVRHASVYDLQDGYFAAALELPTFPSHVSHLPQAPVNQVAMQMSASPTAADATEDGADVPAVKIPKPANCFILYRREKQPGVLLRNPLMKIADVSVIIAAMWKNENEEVKAAYRRLAAGEKAKHKEKYPNWKCSPRKSSDIRRRQGSTHNSGTASSVVPRISSTEAKPQGVMHRLNNYMRNNHFASAPLNVTSANLVQADIPDYDPQIVPYSYTLL